MNRMLAGAALAVAILGSSAAFAATSSTTPHPAAATAPKVDYAARCTSLADQWKTAETANASNTSLAKAKAEAAKGEKLCKSKKTASRKKGVGEFEEALKLLGVTPT